MSKYGGGLRLKAGGGHEEGLVLVSASEMGQAPISAYFGPWERRPMQDGVLFPWLYSEAFTPKPHIHQARYAWHKVCIGNIGSIKHPNLVNKQRSKVHMKRAAIKASLLLTYLPAEPNL
jgi:hypothetical protein